MASFWSSSFWSTEEEELHSVVNLCVCVCVESKQGCSAKPQWLQDNEFESQWWSISSGNQIVNGRWVGEENPINNNYLKAKAGLEEWRSLFTQGNKPPGLKSRRWDGTIKERLACFWGEVQESMWLKKPLFECINSTYMLLTGQDIGYCYSLLLNIAESETNLQYKLWQSECIHLI